MFMFAMQLYQIEMYTVEKLQNMKWIIPSRYFCISYSPQPSRSKRKT